MSPGQDGDEILHTKVSQMLQQIRVVVPGTKALLGFQFVIYFDSRFERLPAGVRYTHSENLMFVVVATILLIAPVGYRQFARNGNDDRQFLRYAGTSTSPHG